MLSNNLMSDHVNSLKDFRCEEFTLPITKTIQSLPNKELGGMAEAMVSLTFLKRRVSLELETVGGPVDVAIISKGDGFIWQKRKHYFDASLKPDYFKRLIYYQRRTYI